MLRFRSIAFLAAALLGIAPSISIAASQGNGGHRGGGIGADTAAGASSSLETAELLAACTATAGMAASAADTGLGRTETA